MIAVCQFVKNQGSDMSLKLIDAVNDREAVCL